jgi:copper resistance protein C
MKSRAALLAAVSLALLAGLSTDLFAHVSLQRAVPAADSIVHGSPGEIRLWFSHRIEAAFSTVRVVDRQGRQVDRLDKQSDPSDPTVLRVSLPPLAAGTYRVHWRVVSVDTHVISGSFEFAVQP